MGNRFFTPATQQTLEVLFFEPHAPLYSLCWLASYGDKRGRNKPIGPGGGTRRLHHMPPASPL